MCAEIQNFEEVFYSEKTFFSYSCTSRDLASAKKIGCFQSEIEGTAWITRRFELPANDILESSICWASNLDNHLSSVIQTTRQLFAGCDLEKLVFAPEHRVLIPEQALSIICFIYHVQLFRVMLFRLVSELLHVHRDVIQKVKTKWGEDIPA